LTQFEKQKFTPEDFKESMGKSLGGLSKLQMDLVGAVYDWRDRVAREEDESPPAVMHTGSILQVACQLPTTAAEVYRVAQPVSEVVRRRALEIVAIVKSAAGSDLSNDKDLSSAAGNKHGAGTQDHDGTSHASTTTANAFVRFLPMTGMLPSVDSAFRSQLSTNTDGGVPAVSASTSKPDKVQSSSWISHWTSQRSELAARPSTAAALRTLIPVPQYLARSTLIPLSDTGSSALRTNAGDSTSRKRGREAETAETPALNEPLPDITDLPKVDDIVEGTPSVAPTQAAAHHHAHAEEDDDASDDGKKVMNLKAAYKGLGRDTRRREHRRKGKDDQ
jgi:hypothetical protein